MKKAKYLVLARANIRTLTMDARLQLLLIIKWKNKVELKCRRVIKLWILT